MVAQAGTPRNVAPCNTFDWLFSNPFQAENGHTSREQVVPRIRHDQHIFVDNESGKYAVLMMELR